MNLTQLIHARWFPTVSKPLVSALVAMGVVYGLHAVGITSFTTWEVNNAITPIVGLIVAAIVAQPNPAAPKQTAADELKQLALQVAHEELANNPDLIKQLAGKVFQGILSAPTTPATLERAQNVSISPQNVAQEATQQGFVS